MVAIGRRIYGLGAIGVGAACLYFHQFAAVWEPTPDKLPNLDAFIWANGLILIAGGLLVNLTGRLAAFGAAFLAVVFALWAIGLHGGVRLIHYWNLWGAWQGFAEIFAMCMGGVVAYGLLRGGDPERSHRIAHLGRIGFAFCLFVFGVSHFLYAKETAGMTPHWLPPSQLFWTYATGVGHILAGLAILTGLQAKLASMLLTLMFVAFGLFVHLPSVLHDPHTPMNWIANGINLLLVGTAWVVMDSLKEH